MSEIQRFGHVLRGVRRCFIANGYDVVSTSELMEWAHGLSRYRGKTSFRHRQDQSRATVRAAERLAVRVGRAKSRGSPWLWQWRHGSDQGETQQLTLR
jgi:hypothetical protein